MIIKNFEIDKFKKSNSNLHLIYGVNEGIKQDLINNIYLEGYKGDIFKYEEHEVLNNIDQFISNLLTKSLLNKEKIIIISRATDKICTLINDLLDREIVETKIIIKSSNLDKKSKLRNLFEKEDQLICIANY